VDLDDTGRGLFGGEKPRCSAAGERCASPSDRSFATLGKETLVITLLSALTGNACEACESSLMGASFSRMSSTVISLQ
jgi:hypothetical protein